MEKQKLTDEQNGEVPNYRLLNSFSPDKPLCRSFEWLQTELHRYLPPDIAVGLHQGPSFPLLQWGCCIPFLWWYLLPSWRYNSEKIVDSSLCSISSFHLCKPPARKQIHYTSCLPKFPPSVNSTSTFLSNYNMSRTALAIQTWKDITPTHNELTFE